MRIRAGYQIVYDCPQPTPMLLMISPHPSRLPDMENQHWVTYDPPIGAHQYTDGFGNLCTRIVAPTGRLAIATDLTVRDSGLPDTLSPQAIQHPVEELPDEILVYLLGSRYCDTDRLSETA
jgi:hypothetical protein